MILEALAEMTKGAATLVVQRLAAVVRVLIAKSGVVDGREDPSSEVEDDVMAAWL